MNPKLMPIFERRSVRKYTADELSDGAIRDILEAGMAAPSAVCRDPWDVVVVRDKAVLAEMATELPNAPMLPHAAAALVVVGNPAEAHDQKLSYLLQDCSALVENMLLATSMLGLGACWLGIHPREPRIVHLRNVLNIPEDRLPIAAIAIGHPADSPEPRTRYNEKKVHWKKW